MLVVTWVPHVRQEGTMSLHALGIHIASISFTYMGVTLLGNP